MGFPNYYGGDYTIAIKNYLNAGEVAHSVRSSLLALKISKTMGYDFRQQRLIEQLTVCHDIGKSRIPIEILSKAGPLTADEWELMKTHSVISYEILLARGYEEEHARYVRWHHEALDGSGYPDGLLGSKIPVISQIISIADYFDAVTSPRPYRDGFLTERQAIKQIDTLRGVKFLDPIVSALGSVIVASNTVQNSTLVRKRQNPSNVNMNRLYNAAFILKGGE